LAIQLDPIDEHGSIAGPSPKAGRRIFGLHGALSNSHRRTAPPLRLTTCFDARFPRRSLEERRVRFTNGRG
jgi:hypothetical protein